MTVTLTWRSTLWIAFVVALQTTVVNSVAVTDTGLAFSPIPPQATGAAATCEQELCKAQELACFNARCSPITYGCRIPCGAIYNSACVSMCSTIRDDTSPCASQFKSQAMACFAKCWNDGDPSRCADRCKTTAATEYDKCRGVGQQTQTPPVEKPSPAPPTPEADTEPPVAWAVPPDAPLERGRIGLLVRGQDNSQHARFEVYLFQDGVPLFPARPVSSRLATGNERYPVTFDLGTPIDGIKPVTGPLFFCVVAIDAAGNRSDMNSGQACAWVPLIVPLDTNVSNTCGGAQWGDLLAGVQNWFLNVQTYTGDVGDRNSLVGPPSFRVDFSEACNLHDAAYAGLTVRDHLNGNQVVDFRTWSRKRVDDKFLRDLQTLCARRIGSQSATALRACQGTGVSTLAAVLLPGAGDYYRAVQELAEAAFDQDLTAPGTGVGSGTPLLPGGDRDAGSTAPVRQTALVRVTTLQGAPMVMRGGIKWRLRQGQTIDVGDTVMTAAGEKVTFTADNADFRVITELSEVSLELRSDDTGQTELTALSALVGLLAPPAEVKSQTAVGGRVTVVSASARYTQHSRVRYTFSEAEDRVTVLEGYVDVRDPRTGQHTRIDQGTTFVLAARRPLNEARVTAATESAAASTFASGPEGWRGGSFPDEGPYDRVIGTATVQWDSRGGPTGGALSIRDPGPGNFFFDAPAAYTGNQQAMYQGELRYDIKSENGDFFDEADVILLGGGLVLVHHDRGRPTANWSSVVVPLVESAWTIDRLDGRSPTRDQFLRALGGITALRIRGEYRNGPDTGWLANVRLIPSGGGGVGARSLTSGRSVPAIAGILVSDQANRDGYVMLSNAPAVARRAPKIYITVQVAGATPGTVVSVWLTYLGNNASLGPLTGEITAGGDIMKAFSFSNTAAEWPTGAFRVTVRLSSGTELTKDFRIE